MGGCACWLVESPDQCLAALGDTSYSDESQRVNTQSLLSSLPACCSELNPKFKPKSLALHKCVSTVSYRTAP